MITERIKGNIRKNKAIYTLLLFSFVSLLFIGLTATSSDFLTAPFRSFKDMIVLLVQWGAIMLVNFPFFFLLSINRYIYALLFPLISLFSISLAYFRYTTGTILTTMIIDVSLDNDLRISQELISIELIYLLVITLLISIAFVYYRFNRVGKQKTRQIFVQSILASVVGILLLSYYPLRRPSLERIPLNLIAVPYQYLKDYQEIKMSRKSLGGSLSIEGERPLVVLILGETLRADHLALNGYPRATNPRLCKETVISYPNIYSEATYTNASLPHILTRADSLHPERAKTEPSFIELFNRLNYQTYWLANQSSSNSFIYFMKECDSLIYANANKSVYVFDKWTDEDLLPHFDRVLKDEVRDGQLIILHTIGSHWYYNAHYTSDFEEFLPTAKSRIVSSNTSEEMINSYDNTVLFTDYFISEIIGRLKDKNALLIYLSDHGEALGEGGQWLHANEVEQAHNPACLLWFSDEYRLRYPERVQTAEFNREKVYRTDVLFHTILEGANIKWEFIDPSLSIFSH